MSINLYARDERLGSVKIGRDGCCFVMSGCLEVSNLLKHEFGSMVATMQHRRDQ